MKIGYACMCLGVPNTNKQSCKITNATKDRLLEIIDNNLTALESIIDYNIKNNIYLFRIGSDLIPFASSPINDLKWWEIFAHRFIEIGTKIKENNIRVSMHPGQYTVLNSPNEEVVQRAIADLEYHNRILDTLGVDSKNKLILHIGGIYNDKNEAKKRFIKNYLNLSDNIKKRLIIENDDKSFNIEDVLEISRKAEIPVVYDNLHNCLNPPDQNNDDYYWISLCKKTWKKDDGIPKIHYSQQDPSKQHGSHSHTIKLDEFLSFYESLKDIDVDIMLEVKDKNLSALKCLKTINQNPLEDQWEIYQYLILERSYELYLELKNLIENKNYQQKYFYHLIDEGLKMPIQKKLSIIAINMIWNILIDKVSEKDNKKYENLLYRLKKDDISIKAMKNFLYRLGEKYFSSLTYNLFFYL